MDYYPPSVTLASKQVSTQSEGFVREVVCDMTDKLPPSLSYSELDMDCASVASCLCDVKRFLGHLAEDLDLKLTVVQKKVHRI